MPAARWTDNDRGWENITRNIFAMDGTSITVGIHGDAGTGEGGESVVDYATENEFGTPDIPARSFIRSTFDEKHKVWERLFVRMEKRLAAGIIDTRQILNALGLRMQSDVQKKIQTLRTPPNAPSTIAMKGSSNPLIDTGIMKARVTYKID